MIYHDIMLNCARCGHAFHPKIGINALSEILMEGVCPQCRWENIKETTIGEIIHTIRHWEIGQADVTDLDQVIITGKPN